MFRQSHHSFGPTPAYFAAMYSDERNQSSGMMVDYDTKLEFQGGETVFLHMSVAAMWSGILRDMTSLPNGSSSPKESTPAGSSIKWTLQCAEDDIAAWREVLAFLYPSAPDPTISWVGRSWVVAHFPVPPPCMGCHGVPLM